jgi:hypothetical protein
MKQKMMYLLKNSSRLVMLALFVLLVLGGAGCKSKKKAMEAAKAAEEKAKMEQEAALKKQRDEEEAALRMEKEAEERAKREAEARKSTPSAKLEEYFNAIAGSGSVASANSSINEALTLFSSPDTPVLIVIHESADGQKDYDRPTTIKSYLNYLKDQKKSMNKVGDLQFDSNGRITSVELIKQN